MHLRTVLFVAGICAGMLSGFSSGLASELAVTALMLGISELVIFWIARKRGAIGVALSLHIAIMSFGFFAGVVRVQFMHERPIISCGARCGFEAVVSTSPERKDEYQLFVVRAVDAPDDAYGIQVRTPLYPQVRIGETYFLEGKVTVPSSSFPHEGKSTFDYASYLRTRDVGSEMMFPHMKLTSAEARTLSARLGRLKEIMIARIVSYVASPSSLLASGMLFGDSSLPEQVKDSFRTAGLSHIVVLSGFNIAIVISFVLLLFRFLPLMLRVSLAALFVIVFVTMVGAEASVIRATLMAFIGLLALALGRQYVARQALAVSFLMIIIYDPFALVHDVSLHLSFLAASGIIYLEAPCSLLLGRYVKVGFVRDLLSTTIAAYLATLPYLAHVFGSVSVYALFANMVVLPLVPVMMLLSSITVVASFVNQHLALACGYIVSILGQFILSVANAVAGLPYAKLSASGVSAFFIALFLCGTGLFLLLRNRHADETAETVSGDYLTDVIPY